MHFFCCLACDGPICERPQCRFPADKNWFEFTTETERGFQGEELIVCKGCYPVIVRLYDQPAAILRLKPYHSKVRLEKFKALEAAEAIKQLAPKAGKVAPPAKVQAVEKKPTRKDMFDQFRKDWVSLYFNCFDILGSKKRSRHLRRQPTNGGAFSGS